MLLQERQVQHCYDKHLVLNISLL